MKVIKPVQMSEALLISTNVTEIEQPWNEQYIYDVGAKVAYSENGIDYGIYELVSVNTNKISEGLVFKPDGTKMYVLSLNSTDIIEFTLSTAWDIGTCTKTGTLRYINENTDISTGIRFDSTGTKMYLVGASTPTVYQFTLGTAWNLDTAVYTKKATVSVTQTSSNFEDLYFNSSGTKLYILNSGADLVMQYSLSTPWEIDTVNYYREATFAVSTQETAPYAMFFNPAGTVLYICGSIGDDINQYTVSTPWDLGSTVTYQKVSTTVTQEGTPTGIAFSTSGDRLYVIGTTSDAVHQYSLTTAYDVGAITYQKSFGLAIFNIPPPETTNWIRVGPTNKMAMFDNIVSTSTKHGSSIQVKIKVGSIDSLALINIVGTSVDLIIRNGPLETDRIIYSSDYTVEPTGIVWSTTPKRINLDTSVITSWYDYFFFDFEASQRTTVLYQGITTGYSDAHATVTINGTGEVSVGNLIFGKTTDLGVIEYGVSAGIIDYSTKEADQYGNTTLVVREYSKRMSANIQVENANLNKVQRVLYGLRATPALWIGSEDPRYEEPLIVYGFYKDFTTTISYPTVSLCSVEIEGII